MKVSKKAKGLVDYSAIYNPVPEYAEEPQYTDEEERIQQEMIEAQIREREENKKALAIWEEQAKKNLDEILNVPGAIADRLTYLFEVKKIEKAAFARQIGSGRTTIHRYLSGESTPTKKKLLIIIDALEMDPADFCYEPKDFKKWQDALETIAKRTNDIFELRDELMASLAKNNFSYKHNGETVRLPYKHYAVIKEMLESSFKVLDLLVHDKYE